MAKKARLRYEGQEIAPETEGRCVTLENGGDLESTIKSIVAEMLQIPKNTFRYINVGNESLIQAIGKDATLILKPRGSVRFKTEEGEYNNILEIWGEDTTYDPMQGASEKVSGAAGLVPAPDAGDQDKCLFGDGTFGNPVPTVTIESIQDEDIDGLMLTIVHEKGQGQMLLIPCADSEKAGVMGKRQAEKLADLPTRKEMDETYAKIIPPTAKDDNVIYTGEMSQPGSYSLAKSAAGFTAVEVIGETDGECWSEKVLVRNHFGAGFGLHGLRFENGFSSGPEMVLTANLEGSVIYRVIGCD